MSRPVLSVFQLNEYIRSMVDADSFLGQVAVRGEISNYKRYPSGHHYFTLKDENSSLKCVMFRGSAAALRFQPENGMQIVALGKVAVYSRDGVYQLYTTAMMVDGAGDLSVAFAQLKKKLEAQGLFEESHKKPLPRFPKIVGIVTSPAGAAVHDMIKIIRRKYPAAVVRLFPVRVQGTEAPGEISDAIRYANRHALADVLIVGRGGGSAEDLWAFNDENVAKAVYNSEIPIISAVGHEPDVTIIDYVSDVRAATPTHGAELAVPDQNALYQELDSQNARLFSAMNRLIQSCQQKLTRLSSSQVIQNPGAYLQLQEKELELLKSRLIALQANSIQQKERQLSRLAGQLDGLSPLKVLSRGYLFAELEDGSIVKSVHQVQEGQYLSLHLQDGKILTKVQGKETV